MGFDGKSPLCSAKMKDRMNDAFLNVAAIRQVDAVRIGDPPYFFREPI